MSDLPRPVAEAGLLFQRPAIATDPVAMRQVVDWGHQQIDLLYPEDPLRAPLNAIRRLRAHQEWDKVVRTAGKELRGTIATSMVRELEFAIQRRQNQILAEDAERQRQAAEAFNYRQRVREHEELSQINARLAEAQLRLAHELNERAEDNASARRIKEKIQATESEIAVLIAQAVTRALGSSTADETIQAVKRVNAEIAAIRNNPHLTDDDKHLQIRTFLEMLPRILHGTRSSDV